MTNAIDRRALVTEAMLAPSVHNVQPARWRFEGDDALILFEDAAVRLPVGDPRGNDAEISLGAAAEGLRLAAGHRGVGVTEEVTALPGATATLIPVARYRLREGMADPDPLAAGVEARRSWRGDFQACASSDRAEAAKLAGDDAAVVTDPAMLSRIARLFDQASHGFMRDGKFRRELVSWMRLSRRHPRWSRDGLNADAMAMNRIEAIGASAVLGPLFALLDRIGLAGPLLAEGKKLSGSAGLVVFHRPVDEAPFISGGHFYRLWLAIEAAGFGAAVLAALADDPAVSAEVATIAGVPRGRRVVSAFRIGRRPAGAIAPRSRRGIDELLV